MVITSLAGTTSIGKFGSACLANSARTMAGCPTKSTRTPYSRAASTLPSTSGRGALSPPMASTAIVIMDFVFWRTAARLGRDAEVAQRISDFYRGTLSGFLDGLALILPTIRADLVRLLHFVAVRALGQCGSLQKIVGAASTRPPLGMSSFRIWHCSTPRLRPARGHTNRQSEPGRILCYGLAARKSIVS